MKRVRGIAAALAAAFCVCLASCRPAEGSRAEDKHPAPPYAGVTVRPAGDAVEVDWKAGDVVKLEFNTQPPGQIGRAHV